MSLFCRRYIAVDLIAVDLLAFYMVKLITLLRYMEKRQNYFKNQFPRVFILMFVAKPVKRLTSKQHP